jgi:hypothetical protein
MKKMPVVILSCLLTASLQAQNFGIASPGKKLDLQFALDQKGEATYTLSFRQVPVIRAGKLGLLIKDNPGFDRNLVLLSVDSSYADQTWEPVWGEENRIRNQYKELAITLRQKTDKAATLRIVFRLYDAGLGFRYELPQQPDLQYFILKGELTSFPLRANHKAWWIPGDYDTNEYFYSYTRLSEVDAITAGNAPEISTRKIFSATGLQTPLMMKSDGGLYINLHEAALVNYPAMQLELDPATYSLKAHLVPDAVGNCAYLKTPCHSPWRVIHVSDKATDILASRIILNLNEPSRIANPGWIRPGKFVGVWWEMHIGKSTWDYAGTQNAASFGEGEPRPHGRHGANTANVKRYIDFAAAHGILGVLVEGWNTGWEDWFGKWKEEVFDFVTPYPDFDVQELHRYAATKGVRLIMHHETSGSATNYDRHIDSAYRFMKNNGYDAVKTGYVGRIIPRGEWHDGQWMVNHYNRVIEKAAAYEIMVDAHEPTRPTGLHRTWPNFMAAEAARGNEFNAWSRGNPPAHETILPFTRLMGGPMDYTPGIFGIRMNAYDSNKREQVHTTLAKQLALYVTLYSPLQMAADLPENYEKHMDAFRFIRDVAVDWDSTVYLDAEPGEYLYIARKAKGQSDWFIGCITGEAPRSASITLGFLPAGRNYEARIYQDAPDAHWERNPMAYSISTKKVKSGMTIQVRLAPGGGAAIHLKELR